MPAFCPWCVHPEHDGACGEEFTEFHDTLEGFKARLTALGFLRGGGPVPDTVVPGLGRVVRAAGDPNGGTIDFGCTCVGTAPETAQDAPLSAGTRVLVTAAGSAFARLAGTVVETDARVAVVVLDEGRGTMPFLVTELRRVLL